MVRKRALGVLALAAVWCGIFVVLSPPASASPDVTVKVTLQRITAIETSEEGVCGTVDWYAKVWINGVEHNNEDTTEQDFFEGNPDITPDWEFSVPGIDVAKLPQVGGVAVVPLRIEVWDEDGGLCFGDDQYDASPTASNAIDGNVAVSPCAVSTDGLAPAGCGSTIVRRGTGDDVAEVAFMVTVDEPTSAPGLRIKCTHTPVWPQPGQPVTVVAQALDGALQPSVVADGLEIWTSQSDKTEVSGQGTMTRTFTPVTPPGGSFTYGCRLRESGTTIFSGWRRVTVGDQAPNAAFPKPAVPILYTGPRASRLDVVFIADRETYPMGAADPQFQTDVADVIAKSYYGFNEFLVAQDMFNFWLLPDNTARADDADVGGCDHDLPVLWDDAFGFADEGIIVHRKPQRDCALRGDRIVSGVVDTNYRSDAFQVITHETGHQPFGLADEYCCDAGYFQTDDAPNVYEEFDGADGCASDAPSLGRTVAECRTWDEDSWWFDPDWWTSERGDVTAGNGNDDLMVDNGPAGAADIRRFNFIFAGCRSAKC